MICTHLYKSGSI